MNIRILALAAAVLAVALPAYAADCLYPCADGGKATVGGGTGGPGGGGDGNGHNWVMQCDQSGAHCVQVAVGRAKVVPAINVKGR